MFFKGEKNMREFKRYNAPFAWDVIELDEDDIMYYYDKLLADYHIKYYQGNLDFIDLGRIEKLCEKLRNITSVYNDNIKNDLIYDFENIIFEFNKNHVKNTLHGFIKQETSITQIIAANNKDNKDKSCSDDGTMFLCQRHIENHPSMMVNNGIGLFYCFGCGFSGTVVNYIMEYENMNYQEAVSLLSRVYLIDIDYNVIAEDDIRIKHYQDHLLSDENINRIKLGLERLEYRKENYYHDNESINAKRARKKYYHELETIDRIKNNVHIKPSTKNKGKVFNYTI